MLRQRIDPGVSFTAFKLLIVANLLLISGCQGKPPKDPAPKPAAEAKKLTAAEYEKQNFLDSAIDKTRTLEKIETIHGQDFVTATDCCKPKGKVTFTFAKGYSGEFLYRNKSGGLKTIKGMYVNIKMQQDKNCCKNTRIVQIKRSYDIGNKPNQWKFDSPYEGDSAYADDYDLAIGGKAGKAATVFDSPGRNKSAKNLRVEYITILLCSEPGKADVPLAYVSWGFDIDKTGKVKPRTPKATCGTPDGLKNVVRVWNKGAEILKTRKKVNIEVK